MMDNARINELFGVTESYQLPDRLMMVLRDENERVKMFHAFRDELEGNLEKDIFCDYFQEQHANRESLMQDFTPPMLAEALAKLATTDSFSKCRDVCAGTGQLTIAAWKTNREADFYCEELSERAFPILLFNMAIRNMAGYAINKDVLTGRFIKGFALKKGEAFSCIEEIDKEPEGQDAADIVITNPPYSLSHKWNEKEKDPRFDGYCYPPSKAADYAFILHGLSHLKTSGTLAAILPHGVLFRGGKEAQIRRKLIENGLLSAIVGLPEKLFLNTSIPVCFMIFRKMTDDASGVLFIDASKHYEKGKKQNFMRREDVERILEASKKRGEIERLSHLATMTEMEKNDYNLNIPRYVDTIEKEPPIDIVEVTRNLVAIENEIEQRKAELYDLLMELECRTPEDTAAVRTHLALMKPRTAPATKQKLKPKPKPAAKAGVRYDQASLFD